MTKVESKFRQAEEGEDGFKLTATDLTESDALYDELEELSHEDIKLLIKAAHEKGQDCK